jgi:NAD(P)-dependent dehydrogenase (short-subunit alcohol dehydrogenase family)
MLPLRSPKGEPGPGVSAAPRALYARTVDKLLLPAEQEFAKRGANTYMVCRNAERGAEAVQKVKAASGNQNVHLQVCIRRHSGIVGHLGVLGHARPWPHPLSRQVCDVSSLAAVSALVKEWEAAQRPVHVLVNNAGWLAAAVATRAHGTPRDGAARPPGPRQRCHHPAAAPLACTLCRHPPRLFPRTSLPWLHLKPRPPPRGLGLACPAAAGILVHEYTASADGYESCFATNTLGSYALTWGLFPLLRAAQPAARVIFVSSGGMYTSGSSIPSHTTPHTTRRCSG